MGSLAFWQELSTNNPNAAGKCAEAVMNFNLWSHCGNKDDSFLDIGFMLSNIQSAVKLHLYIPFGENKDVSDLAPIIKESEVISAIFNDNYAVKDLPNPENEDYFWPVMKSGENKYTFIIYQWSISGNQAVTLKNDDSGSGIRFSIDSAKLQEQIRDFGEPYGVKSSDSFYFRFRIPLHISDSHSSIVRSYRPKNTFLQSTFATTYIVDFRFNDMRSLPSGIRSEISRSINSFVAVQKLHFFLMTKAHVDVETGAKDTSLRELEHKIWDGYIQKRFETKDIVAYHCAQKNGNITQWEFFAKLKVNNSTFRVVIEYLVALAILSIFFNIASAGLCKLLGF